MGALVNNVQCYIIFFISKLIDNFHNSYVFGLCNKPHYSSTQNSIDFNGKSYQQIIAKIKAECCKNHR